MNQVVLGSLVSLLIGLLASETTELSPWLALRVVRWAAKLWAGTDVERAALLAEEWEALINDYPGKITKLLRASSFAFSGVQRAHVRHLRLAVVRLRRVIRLPRQTPAERSAMLVLSLTSILFGAITIIRDGAAASFSLDVILTVVAVFVLTGGAAFFAGRLAGWKTVQRRLRPAYCFGGPDAQHDSVTLRSTGIKGHHIVYQPCSTCGSVQKRLLTPHRATD